MSRFIVFLITLSFCVMHNCFGSKNINYRKRTVKILTNEEKDDFDYRQNEKSNDKKKRKNSLITNNYGADIILRLVNYNEISKFNNTIQRKPFFNSNTRTFEYNTSIGYHIAVSPIFTRNIEILEAMFRGDIKFDLGVKLDSLGNNPFHLMAMIGWISGIKKLIKFAPNAKAINQVNRNGKTPLQIALMHNDKRIAEAFLRDVKNRKFSYNQSDDNVKRDEDLSENAFKLCGYDKLSMIIFNKDMNALEQLVYNNSSSKDNYEFTNKKREKFFYKSLDTYGNSAIHLMVATGWKDGLEILLNTKDPKLINAKNNLGRSAVHIAVSMNDYGIVSTLLSSKYTSLTIENSAGNTAIILALRNYGLYPWEKKNSLKIIHDLCHAPNDDYKDDHLQIPDSKGNTPLHFAMMIGKIRIAMWMLALGVNPKSKNYSNQTPADKIGLDLYSIDSETKLMEFKNFLKKQERQWKSGKYELNIDKEDIQLFKSIGIENINEYMEF